MTENDYNSLILKFIDSMIQRDGITGTIIWLNTIGGLTKEEIKKFGFVEEILKDIPMVEDIVAKETDL